VSKQRSTILFVCVHNAGRSQMAAGLARNLGGERVEVRSAGSDPAEQVNPAAVAAMAEVDVDLQDAAPKLLEIDAVRGADVIVTMGCGDACPVFPGKRYEDWDLEDPAGKDLAQVRQIRDEIRSRVEALLESLGAS
jgi:arsenate reductase